MKTYKVDLTEEFIKEAHAAASDEWKKKIENLVPEAFEPQIGKWYKHNDKVFFITEFDEGHAYGYGIDNEGDWLDARDITLDLCICSVGFVNDLIPATDKEVEDMLTQEAKKQGLVEGVEVKSFLSGYEHKIINNYELVNNDLYVDSVEGCACIFKDGVWAKPIKTENSKKLKEVRDFANRIGTGLNGVLKRIAELETELEKLKSEL